MLLLMSGEVTDFGSDEGENGEDDIEIPDACPRGAKRAQIDRLPESNFTFFSTPTATSPRLLTRRLTHPYTLSVHWCTTVSVCISHFHDSLQAFKFQARPSYVGAFCSKVLLEYVVRTIMFYFVNFINHQLSKRWDLTCSFVMCKGLTNHWR